MQLFIVVNLTEIEICIRCKYVSVVGKLHGCDVREKTDQIGLSGQDLRRGIHLDVIFQLATIIRFCHAYLLPTKRPISLPVVLFF